eukprot:m.8772 g.8772  ORF g.8772 m.8772 type:complete len:106 (-) comp5287_c0_seq1:1262-1579(-)
MPRSALAVCLLLLLGMAHARQYLCVNLAPGQEWNQDRPQSVTPALLANIAKVCERACLFEHTQANPSKGQREEIEWKMKGMVQLKLINVAAALKRRFQWRSVVVL